MYPHLKIKENLTKTLLPVIFEATSVPYGKLLPIHSSSNPRLEGLARWGHELPNIDLD